MTDFDTIDADVRRIVGKKVYEECKNEQENFLTIEGDTVKYSLTIFASMRLHEYMGEHPHSRLARAYLEREKWNITFKGENNGN